MSQDTFQVSVPSSLLQFGLDREEVQHRTTEWLVLSLFTEGRVSTDKAARLLGMGRVEFLDLLRARGIAYVDYTPEELEDEFGAVDALGAGGEE